MFVRGVLLFAVLGFSSGFCNMTSQQPVWLLSHGAGPCFFMTGGQFAEIDANSQVAADYKKLGSTLHQKPSAILVISAHHQTHGPDLEIVGDTDDQVPLFFDYYGFPPSTYQIKWPARGSKMLCDRIRKLLPEHHIQERNERGFDHGVFIPLALVFPNAEIPTVQLSIRDTLDPEFHLALGKKLAELRNENILVIGSGQATHGQGSMQQANQFVDWLTKNVESAPNLARASAEAPHFKAFHTPSEHFVPWIVAAAASGKDKAQPKLLLQGWWKSLALHSWSLN